MTKQTKQEREGARRTHRDDEIARLKAEAEWAGWCKPRYIRILFCVVFALFLVWLGTMALWVSTEMEVEEWEISYDRMATLREKALDQYRDAWRKVTWLAVQLPLTDDDVRWIWHGEIPDWWDEIETGQVPDWWYEE